MKGDKVESEEEEHKCTEVEEEDEEIVEYSVQGDLLMVKKDEAVPNQRANLFNIQGMVQGKTYLIVIDTDSCTNVASAGWVSKLGLQVEQHPRPYVLHWLSPQGAVHVHKQVRVPLSIGDYTDEIVCDVVPMEATHLILGRP